MRIRLTFIFAVLLTQVPGFMVPSFIRAQPLIQFIPARASLGGTVDGSWRNSSGFLGRPFNQNNFRQWVVLPFGGVLVNSGIANYSFSLKPNFTQQNSTDLPDALKTRNLGYSADASLLSSKVISFNLHWSRDTGLQKGGFGTQGEFKTDVFNPSLRLNTIYLPVRVAYSRRTSRNLTQVGPGLVPIEQSDGVRTFLVEARNSKLTAGFERSEFDDRLRENDFASKNIYLDHRYRWGKRSELTSRYSRTERTGTLPYMRLSWGEEVRLQHTSNTFTELGVSRFKSEGLGGKSEGRTWSSGFTSRFGPLIDYGARLSNSVSTFDEGSLKAFSVGPWLGLSTRLGQNIRLSANGSLRYLKRRLENESNNFIRVINESYSIDETRIVFLNPLNIDPLSLLVQNAEQTFFLVEGLDYEVVTIGRSVEIHVLPGARVTTGDVILISYQYRPEFDATDEGVAANFNIGLRFAGINLRHVQSRRATSVSGDDFIPTSGDFNQHSTTLNTFQKTPIGYLDLNLSNRMRRSGSLRYTTNEVRASLSLPPWKTVRVHINVLARSVHEGGDQVRLYALGTAISKNFEPNIRLHAGANYQNWEQVQQLIERSFNVNASLDYQIGLVGLKLRYEYDHRNTVFRSTGHRVSMYILRRF